MNTPEGWKLVPVEPTQEMQSAAERYARHHNRVPFSAGYYRAMLSAAPTPPEQPARCHWPGCPHGEDCVHAKSGQPAAQGELTDEQLVALWKDRSDSPSNREISTFAHAVIAADRAARAPEIMEAVKLALSNKLSIHEVERRVRGEKS